MAKEKQIISDRPEKPQRRTLLNRLWALFGLLACIELGWLGASILKSRKTRNRAAEGGRFIDAGRIEAFNPGDVKAVPEGMFYLARLEDSSFIALSRTCTHLGCALSWDDKENKFICPCHGSTYDQNGVVLTPPAIRPLDFYPVRIENGRIRINIAAPLRRENFDQNQTTTV